MSNFTFGNARHQYYETISGGSGAGPGWHGTPVVQTHMTNSRLTDPEVLEFRFPVRLESYAIRAGSGVRAVELDHHHGIAADGDFRRLGRRVVLYHENGVLDGGAGRRVVGLEQAFSAKPAGHVDPPVDDRGRHL